LPFDSAPPIRQRSFRPAFDIAVRARQTPPVAGPKLAGFVFSLAFALFALFFTPILSPENGYVTKPLNSGLNCSGTVTRRNRTRSEIRLIRFASKPRLPARTDCGVRPFSRQPLSARDNFRA
jgi:hypothetical protein